jgi:hypothetical protein
MADGDWAGEGTDSEADRRAESVVEPREWSPMRFGLSFLFFGVSGPGDTTGTCK